MKLINQGFTLIEIMIVVLIIGVLASVGIPRFMGVKKREGEQFIARLNNIVKFGVQNAIKTNKVQKILFDFNSKEIELLELDSQKPILSADIPESIEITSFYIDGKNQFMAGTRKNTAYFLINADGVSQRVKLALTDSSFNSSNNSKSYMLNLNPFKSQFSVEYNYD